MVRNYLQELARALAVVQEKGIDKHVFNEMATGQVVGLPEGSVHIVEPGYIPKFVATLSRKPSWPSLRTRRDRHP
jgi:hypothetical protein